MTNGMLYTIAAIAAGFVAYGLHLKHQLEIAERR